MFGTYRYVLALMVAFAHIHPLLFGRFNWLGVYAVFGFFTLSGYLMTRVLHETYGYSGRGFLRYLTNRALRIFPPYWLAASGTVLLLVLLPDAAGPSDKLVYLPTTLAESLRNFVLVGMTWKFRPALVAPAWSLHLELLFYVMMGIGLSASRRRAMLWLIASVVWTAAAFVFGLPSSFRYCTLLGASLPFSIGAVLYFLPPGRRWMLAAPVVFLPHAVAARWIWPDVDVAGFYASLVLATVSVPALAAMRGSPRWRRLDGRLGDLSYPIFLLHTQTGFLVARLWPAQAGSALALFVLTLPVLHVFAFLLHWCAGSSVEALRDRVRAMSLAAQRS